MFCSGQISRSSIGGAKWAAIVDFCRAPFLTLLYQIPALSFQSGYRGTPAWFKSEVPTKTINFIIDVRADSSGTVPPHSMHLSVDRRVRKSSIHELRPDSQV